MCCRNNYGLVVIRALRVVRTLKSFRIIPSVAQLLQILLAVSARCHTYRDHPLFISLCAIPMIIPGTNRNMIDVEA